MVTTVECLSIQHVFDPQTKARAGKRPRLLISDGFAAYKSLESLKFCLANNIIPCRLPSHISHKLQPCDVGVFSALKTAYREHREQVELFYQVELMLRARNSAGTPRNINAGWSKTGLFPWNPNRVLKDIKPPPGASCSNRGNVAKVAHYSDGYKTKLVGGTKTLSFSPTVLPIQRRKHSRTSALLRNDHERLLAQKNEKRCRTSNPARKVGNAKVMSYEDIIEAQRNLEAKRPPRLESRTPIKEGLRWL
ncbi:uncharacterized protein N7511_010596 [Penicillium nucicola]|uniref:uncharacterized protein n=1 Tax=Penicillium nucicola TaxID=1850975 RepID=UPI0025454AA1|nr:uncharacterized protein N7511_010596 [Penicillium nucicola]KAJ5748900.1 hypothetical protein N7511_010596 [Penicillium nucicola]